MAKINRSLYSNYGMIGAGLLVLTTFDTLSGYFFGSLGRLALLESIMHIMLIALLLMKAYHFVLAVPYAFLAVTVFFHGDAYLTTAFDFALYFLMFLMCFLLLSGLLPQKAHDATAKLWFVPASVWLVYNFVIMIIFIRSYHPVDFTVAALMTVFYAASHMMVGLWLKKPYKK